LRHAPIGEQVAAARRRLAMVPEELRVKRVPERLWPAGTRYCSGCCSFVDLADVATGASRCRACASAATHAARIEKVYGLTAEQYDALLERQGGKCAICRARPRSKRLAVDHNHKTGEVRGLLCSRCNHDLMGSAWDSMAMALALWHYMNTPPTSGAWVAPELGLEPPAAQRPAAASRPADDQFVTVGGKVAEVTAERVSLVLPPGVTRATCDHPRHYELIGGTRDDRGAVRIYVAADAEAPPF
jgi:hypothetical protein